MNRATWLGAFAVCLAALLAAGCGQERELRVKLGADTSVAEKQDVLLDGKKAGLVRSLEKQGNATIATVAVQEEFAFDKLREGLVARDRDGQIRLDSTEVEKEARPLREGEIIEAESGGVLEIIEKYSKLLNVATVAVGLAAIVVVFLVCRAMLRLGIVLVSATLALFLAVLVYPVPTPLVRDHVYPTLERFRQAEVARDAEAKAPGQPSGGAPRSAAPAGKAAAADRLGSYIRRIPLPSPGVVSFFGCWLVGFVSVQVVVGFGLRATRKRAS